ncbi:RNA polymerase subunit sigma-70 [Streptomyces sp. WMMC500]|uniref:RNA polymerase subunit sigma-70 n=1 Tax=Streptomyces sp. WMMC500 TaxID=3015154 RepID=UPI00248B50FE|nr:RNA polymerase subunit sigma-70 [Streptomyces sp. WMMC500]WBB59313.1 RNA polymerase subunit sigma-70 [Streptomyces sp. WMMC500]
MPDETCAVCGGPLPPRAGRRGRSTVYCSAACRQRAYRGRRAPEAAGSVRDLISDVAARAGRLTPRPPETFYAEVTELSSSVGRLRRIARTARDAAAEGPAAPEDGAPAPDGVPPGTAGESSAPAAGESSAPAASENVTPRPVTNEPAEPPDDADFAGLMEAYRRELQVHCYRMTGSYDESEDLVQETFLKAWRRRETYEGRAAVRAWLYRIATNTCLDHLRRHSRAPARYERLPGMAHGDAEPPTRITWLQPYPDELLADVPAADAGPEAQAGARETVDLVFLAALQHLPPRQRAVFVLRDVVGLPAAQTAGLLDLSTAAVNSALQRARPALRAHLPAGGPAEWTPLRPPTRAELAAVDRYREAAERLDMAAMAAALTEDAKLTMPPNPFWFVGRQTIVDFVSQSLDPALPAFFGDWRHVRTRANGRPAVAGYVRRPGTTVYRAQTLEVLRVADGRIAEITTFEPHLLPAFGLPMTL